MARPSRYSPDFRARTIRLVGEASPDHETAAAGAPVVRSGARGLG